MNRAVLIFSGYNQRALVSFLRTLESNKIAYFIFAKNEKDTILITQYRNQVWWVRERKALNSTEILKHISTLMSTESIDSLLIAPSTEFLNRFLLQFRSKFEKQNCIIPLVNEKLYVQISDKKSFTELCAKHGINIPKEYPSANYTNLPLVAKPIKYNSSEGIPLVPVIIQDNQGLDSFNRNESIDDYYFQKYIGGRSLYLLMYISLSNDINLYSQENLIQQAEGKSMILAISSDFHLKSEALKYVTLFKKLNFKGLIMIEVKQMGMEFYMIEANPRFWGPSQLLVDSNNNFFELLLKDYGFIDKAIDLEPIHKGDIYFWRGGLYHDKKNQVTSTFYSGATLHNSQIREYSKFEVYNKPDTIQIFKREYEE